MASEYHSLAIRTSPEIQVLKVSRSQSEIISFRIDIHFFGFHLCGTKGMAWLRCKEAQLSWHGSFLAVPRVWSILIPLQLPNSPPPLQPFAVCRRNKAKNSYFQIGAAIFNPLAASPTDPVRLQANEPSILLPVLPWCLWPRRL